MVWWVCTDVSEEISTASVTLMIEAARSSHTSTFFYQATCHTPEDIFVVIAGPSNFFAYLPWNVPIKYGIMGVHVRGTVLGNLTALHTDLFREPEL